MKAIYSMFAVSFTSSHGRHQTGDGLGADGSLQLSFAHTTSCVHFVLWCLIVDLLDFVNPVYMAI